MATTTDPDWLKKARAWTSATKMNQAEQSFGQAGMPVPVQQVARQIAGLYEGMRYGAEDAVDQYDARSAAARAAMLNQFAETAANTKAAYGNSQNYQSELARRLGLQQVLQGPGVESQNQQTNQVLALNNANKTNQLASYDLLKGGYGELLRDRLGSFDVQAGTTLATLLAQLQAQQAEAAARGGGGGGRGRGGGGGSSEANEGGFAFGEQGPSDFIVMNPYNPPSGSTYSADYVRPDIGPGSIGWKGPQRTPTRPKKSTLGKTSRAYNIAHGRGNTSRAYSITHGKKG